MTLKNFKKIAVIGIALYSLFVMNNGMAQNKDDNNQFGALQKLWIDITEIAYGSHGMDEIFACQDIESIKSIIIKFLSNRDKLSVEDMYDLTEYFNSLESHNVKETSAVGIIKNKLLQNKRIILETIHNAIYEKH